MKLTPEQADQIIDHLVYIAGGDENGFHAGAISIENDDDLQNIISQITLAVSRIGCWVWWHTPTNEEAKFAFRDFSENGVS